MAAKRNVNSGDKEYLLELKNGQQRRLKVPASWKITFGPTVPFERKQGRGFNEDNGIWALRLYDGTALRAIFTDVRMFRDLSIAVAEKRIRTKRQVMEKESRKGGKAVVAEARIEEWVDPDAPESGVPEEDYLRLDYKHEEEGGLF